MKPLSKKVPIGRGHPPQAGRVSVAIRPKWRIVRLVLRAEIAYVRADTEAEAVRASTYTKFKHWPLHGSDGELHGDMTVQRVLKERKTARSEEMSLTPESKVQRRLVYEETGHPVRVGDRVRTSCNEDHVEVTDIEPPRHEGSTGRVYVKYDDGFVHGYFPTVIGAVWR